MTKLFKVSINLEVEAMDELADVVVELKDLVVDFVKNMLEDDE